MNGSRQLKMTIIIIFVQCLCLCSFRMEYTQFECRDYTKKLLLSFIARQSWCLCEAFLFFFVHRKWVDNWLSNTESMSSQRHQRLKGSTPWSLCSVCYPRIIRLHTVRYSKDTIQSDTLHLICDFELFE